MHFFCALRRASTAYPRRGRGRASTEYPRGTRGGARPASTEYPRGSRGGAATRLQGNFEVHLTITAQVDSMTVNADDTSCAAPDGSACAFSASFPVTAQLASGAQIKLTFSDLNFQCKCTGTFGGAFQTDPVNLGTETCTSTDAKAKGTLTACFAGCDPGGAITSANLTKFEIEDSTTVTCDSDKGFWADGQNLIMQPFLKDIYGAVNEPIEEAINGEFKTLIDGNDLETCGGS